MLSLNIDEVRVQDPSITESPYADYFGGLKLPNPRLPADQSQSTSSGQELLPQDLNGNINLSNYRVSAEIIGWRRAD